MHRSGRRGGRRTVWPCAPCTGRCLDRMAPVKRRTAHQQDYFRVTWRADRTARHGSNRDRDPVRGALPLLLLPACLARSVVSYCPSPYPSRSPPARPPLPPVLPTNPSMVYPGRDHSLHCLGSQRVRTRSHGSIRDPSIVRDPCASIEGGAHSRSRWSRQPWPRGGRWRWSAA